MTLRNAVEFSETQRLNTATVNDEELLFSQWQDTVIIGQPRGKQAVRTAYRRSLSRLRVGRKPRAAFIFLGPTTCGKSEIVYRFAEWLHGDRRCLLKIDGSEYQHDGELTKLKGATNMWAGRVNKYAADYKPPVPTEKDTTCELNHHNVNVYARAYSKTGRKSSVILVDEWDKGCREFNDIWLSIMRDGVYTNGGSEEVDFSETIIFFTGNNGSRAVEAERDKRKKGGLGFENQQRGLSQDEAEKMVTEHLKAFAPPEFRSRINELGGVVFFDELTPEQVFEVCGVKVREAKAVAKDVAGVYLKLEDDVTRWLLSLYENDLSKVSGGLTTHVLDVLDNELIKGTVVEGDTVSFTAGGGKADALEVVRHERRVPIFRIGDAEYLAELAKAANNTPSMANLPLSVNDVDDATAISRLGPHGLRDNRVHGATLLETRQEAATQEALAAAKTALTKTAPATTAVEPTGRVFQPFILTAVLESEDAVSATRTKLIALEADYKFKKVHEEIDPVEVQTSTGPVRAFRLNTHVLGLIEYVAALKTIWPKLQIKTEETAL